jgi:hypothetical protein
MMFFMEQPLLRSLIFFRNKKDLSKGPEQLPKGGNLD